MRAIEAIGATLAGPRIDAENTTVALSERAVRSSVVRLPPLVHSTLDHHGFAPTLIAIARERASRATSLPPRMAARSLRPRE